MCEHKNTKTWNKKQIVDVLYNNGHQKKAYEVSRCGVEHNRSCKNSLLCDRCNKIRAGKLRSRLKGKSYEEMITLNFADFVSPESLKKLKVALSELGKEAKRKKSPLFGLAGVWSIQTKGGLHVHFLSEKKTCREKIIEVWQKWGGSADVHFSDVFNVSGALSYILRLEEIEPIRRFGDWLSLAGSKLFGSINSKTRKNSSSVVEDVEDVVSVEEVVEEVFTISPVADLASLDTVRERVVSLDTMKRRGKKVLAGLLFVVSLFSSVFLSLAEKIALKALETLKIIWAVLLGLLLVLLNKETKKVENKEVTKSEYLFFISRKKKVEK